MSSQYFIINLLWFQSVVFIARQFAFFPENTLVEILEAWDDISHYQQNLQLLDLHYG